MNLGTHSPLAQGEGKPVVDGHRRRYLWLLRGYVARDGLALLVFLLIAVLTMLPVLPHMRTQALGGPGDTHLYTYMTGWMAQALALGESPFVDPRTNYPDGLVVTATDEPYLLMLSLAPVTLALGPTFTYNLIIFLSTLLTGYITFLWLRKLTGSWAAGISAGLIFMLAPARMSHIFGHLALIATFVVPLFFWVLDDVLTRPRLRFRHLVRLGIATFTLGATSQYMLILCLTTGAIYTLLTVLPNLRFLRRKGWGVAQSVVIGAGISLIPDLTNAGQNLYRTYRLSDIRHWAADPVNFVLPYHLHPLWGAVIERLRPEPYWGEKTLYLGAVAVILALVALLAPAVIRKQRLWVWLGVVVSTAIFALGHDLHINNQPVQPEDPFLLPAAYLAQLPFMNVVRVWPRFGIITSLFVACLSGVGVAYLTRRFPRLPVAGVVCTLLLLDFLPPRLGTTSMKPRPVDQWLAQQSGDFAVAFLPPFGPGEDTSDYEALYGSLFHAKQLPAFNHPFHRSRA